MASSDSDEIEREESLQGAVVRRYAGDFTEDEQEIMDVWNTAENYSELLDLSRQFLRGELPFTPAHLSPMYSETESLVPGLLRLHDFRMLTFESQPSKDCVLDYVECACSTCDCEYWRETSQRTFISFAIPLHYGRFSEEALQTFLTEMMVDDHFYVCVTMSGKPCEREGLCGSPCEYTSSFPAEWETHLVKRAEELQDVDTAEAEPWQHIVLGCACRIKQFETDAGLIEALEPLVIHVLARSLTEDDLAGKIEAAAIRAGLEKLYEGDAGTSDWETETDSDEEGEDMEDWREDESED